MQIFISLAAICLAAVCLSISIGHTAAYRRVCYLTNWSQYRPGPGRFFPENLDASLCTHVIFAFGKVVGNTVQPFEKNDHSTPGKTGMYERLNNMKIQHPHLKTMLAIGGWTHGSQPFTAMSSTAAGRRAFAQDSAEYLRRWNFDGFDLDWEYPANTGIDFSPPEDRERIVLLLQELRRTYEAEAVSSGKERLLLGLAGNAGKDKLDRGYDIPRIANKVDFISIMSYDYHGTWEQVTGINAPLTGRAGETAGNEFSHVEFSADYYVHLGAPREKLNIGLATYGHSFTLVNSNDYGVGAPVRGGGRAGMYTRESGFLAYYEICQMLQQGATRYWHAEHQAPYAVLGNQWVGYDDVESLQLKIDYVKRSNYGGIMVWSVDLDDFQNQCGEGPYPLMKAINNMLGGSNPPIIMTTERASSARTEPPTASTTTPRSPYSVDRTTQAPRVSRNTETTTTPTTTAARTDCQGRWNGFYAEPTSCSAYYICAAGLKFELNCIEGLLFDTTFNRCNYAYQVNCGSRTMPTTPTTTTTARPRSASPRTTRAVTTPVIVPTRNFCDNRPNGLYRMPNNCGSFYQCTGRMTFRQRCPPALVFDENLNSCNYRYAVPGC